MSDQERMDRANRIRQLREGRRAGPPETEEDDSDDETGGSSPDRTESSDSTSAELDDAVVAAVERVSGASAPVPAAEEQGTDEGGATAVTEDDPADGAPDPPAGGVTATARSEAEADVPDPAADGTDDGSDRSDAETDDPEEAAATGHRATADTRVLEFTLGDEQYCLDIEYVEEIVKDETITRVPNTPDFVEGVVDLRGQITTILDPKILLQIDDTDPGSVLVVFDAGAFDEQGHLGWIVDDVRQVAPVFEDEVDDPPVADDHVQGVIDREEGFVVWTTPEMAFEETA